MDDPNLGQRLKVLEAVTDGALARLDLDKILATLLDQVIDLIEVDTAVVLLHDPASDHLIAVAAAGFDEEVRQGVRVPVGQGFAGRVARRKEPVIMSPIDPAVVVNPLLWKKGIQALLGVPLLAQDRVVGVLHVGSLVPRDYTQAEVELLQLVGDRLALAVQAHQSISERAATTALQRSLVPAHLPDLPGLRFAARYVPGADTKVGGDWYDVFALPDGRLGIVIGDVVGHGLTAAVVMGRLRSSLRAYALDEVDPGIVLSKLDRKASHFEQGAVATVIYAVLDLSRQRLVMSVAGHPQPITIAPGRPAVFLDIPIDPPVGFGLATRNRRTGTVDLPPGGLIAWYTDGLVERRDQPIDDGLALLREAITSDSPERVCAEMMEAMVGTRTVEDDIALLVLKRDAEPVEEPTRELSVTAGCGPRPGSRGRPG